MKKTYSGICILKRHKKDNIALNLILLRRGAVLIRRVRSWDRKLTNARFSKQVEGVLKMIRKHAISVTVAL